MVTKEHGLHLRNASDLTICHEKGSGKPHPAGVSVTHLGMPAGVFGLLSPCEVTGIGSDSCRPHDILLCLELSGTS